ncbi:hypothetical protein [Pseudomonas trivialis]|uniref:hypothetical protein n=1 Tax=Pseudomonas trivialis TaxID=200450 RepID=UPI0011875660|nr:hypothetical protein [Pseudomonas trivialis]
MPEVERSGKVPSVDTAVFSHGSTGASRGDVADNVNTGTVLETLSSVIDNAPIRLKPNPRWVNQQTRLACKYSPVKVPESGDKDVSLSMQAVLQNRIEVCRALAGERSIPGDNNRWLSFIRGPQLSETHLNRQTVPALVISGGSANKLAADLRNDYSLAWHPKNMRVGLDGRPDPVYLLVHRLDYHTYMTALSDALACYPNLRVIGWDGGRLTGFGAARAAALGFADSLPWRPERIMMIDQDVVVTEKTRHSNPAVRRRIEGLHQTTHQPIVGFGVGYPTRQPPLPPFKDTAPPTSSELDGPAEQFVSVQAPYRLGRRDGIYDSYMVAGGEDMLMSKHLGLSKEGRNAVLVQERIVKKELIGPPDVPNAYWNEGRVQTLKALFEAEKNTMVAFEGENMTLDKLMSRFVESGWISSHPSAESYTAAACIVERIILRLTSESKV